MTHRLPDQFEVEPNFFYSGSYTDGIYRGSIFDAGGRFLVASIASGSDELSYANKHSEFIEFSGSNRNRSRGIDLRFRHFVSNTERYQDTLLPNILDAYYLVGGRVARAMHEYGTNVLKTTADAPVGAGSYVAKLIFTTFGTTASLNDDTNISDAVWFASFPFQTRYKNLFRNLEHRFYRSSIYYTLTASILDDIMTYGVTATPLYTSLTTVEIVIPSLGITPPPAGNSGTEPKRFIFLDVSGSTSAGEQFLGILGSLYPPASVGNFDITEGTERPAEKQLTKLFFGIGNSHQGIPISNGSESVVSTSHLEGADTGIINGYYVSSVDIRGWRYGVVSGFPFYTSCIFRSSHYGQFRDMLEQRKYTKFFNLEGIGNRLTGKRANNSSPIFVQFVSGSDSFVTASSPSNLNPTDSGIYDFECKSGQPFFDVDAT